MAEQSAGQKKPTGLTKTSGWQVGARKTMAVNLDHAWKALTSPEGTRIWLGEAQSLAPGLEFSLADGTQCAVRVFKPNSHLRLGWQPPGWAQSSTIQLRVISSGKKTIIAFHQENMPSEAARTQRQTYYKGVLSELESFFSK